MANSSQARRHTDYPSENIPKNREAEKRDRSDTTLNVWWRYGIAEEAVAEFY